MTKKKSAVEKEYQRQYNRIKNYIKSMEEAGYVLDSNALPKIPKKITPASVRRLKAITSKTLYAKSTYTRATGETIPGTKRRREELKYSRETGESVSRKHHKAKTKITKPKSDFMNPPSVTDLILSQVEDLINRFPDGYDWRPYQQELHEKHKTILEKVLDGQIRMYGRTVVAMRMEKVGQDIVQFADRIVYGDSEDEAFQADVAWFASLIKGESLSAEEALEIEELASMYEV